MKILCLLFSIGCFPLSSTILTEGILAPMLLTLAQLHAQLEQTGANFMLE